ncbi:MAG: SDR family oxidoreductase, partial [Candidatus Omnitrophica bacterium]|nr:SDR family oxidoreductase [Candidatus Omnitrophota bacterium]
MKNNKILILGATGTLGHKLLQVANRYEFDAWGTVVKFNPILENIGIAKDQLFCEIDIESEMGLRNLSEIIASEKFKTVINCIGIIPQKTKDPVKTIYCNSYFPHKIAKICSENNSKLIHLSTDCVFSGRKGMYTENDEPDATGLYGKSKELGEVCYGGHLTIRTSFIGREISDKKVSLLEWFLSQSGEINGFSKAIWSGLTTNSLSEVICAIVKDFSDLSGIVHASNQPIDKYSLLLLCKKFFDKNIIINKEEEFECDK